LIDRQPQNGLNGCQAISEPHQQGFSVVNETHPLSADMGCMKKTVFALASIDYRLATQAVFLALIQDCNRATSFLYDNANK
jgi:hypothetical protein